MKLMLWTAAAVSLACVILWAAEPAPIPLGVNASLRGRQLLPPDNPWNRDISQEPVDSKSDALIASIGPTRPLHPDFGSAKLGDAPWGIPYIVVSGEQKKVPVSFEYKDESDAGPYPIPPDALIEGGPKGEGDRHVLVLDRDHWKLYELFRAFPMEDGSGWKAGSGAVFDLRSNALRPAGWTSTDAAGLPVLPGLVRYDEIEAGEIRHAVRFTVVRSRHAYVAPARHYASPHTDPNLPPMGMRVRLKADYDISKFPRTARIILTAFKKYGLILADNGGNWFFDGAPDARWNDEELETLKRVKGASFEVVKMNEIVTR